MTPQSGVFYELGGVGIITATLKAIIDIKHNAIIATMINKSWVKNPSYGLGKAMVQY